MSTLGDGRDRARPPAGLTVEDPIPQNGDGENHPAVRRLRSALQAGPSHDAYVRGDHVALAAVMGVTPEIAKAALAYFKGRP